MDSSNPNLSRTFPHKQLPLTPEGVGEHMRANALSYFTERGEGDPIGEWLWQLAKKLESGEKLKIPTGGAKKGSKQKPKPVLIVDEPATLEIPTIRHSSPEELMSWLEERRKSA
jgi:hypothetical protein